MGYGKHFFRFMIVLIFMLIVFSVPCVFATWNFCTDEQITGETKTFHIAYFPWVGEDILPDEPTDDNTTTQLGGLEVVTNALNNAGLSSQSKLNQYISKRLKNFNKFEYGSVDVKEDVSDLLSDVADFNPNFELILSGTIAGSGNNKYIESFYLYMVDKDVYDNTMALWNEAENRGEVSKNNYEDNPSIFDVYFQPVYRVKLEKNAYDEWHATIAQMGYCGFGYYEGSNNGGGQKAWAFEPSSWVEISQMEINEL